MAAVVPATLVRSAGRRSRFGCSGQLLVSHERPAMRHGTSDRRYEDGRVRRNRSAASQTQGYDTHKAARPVETRAQERPPPGQPDRGRLLGAARLRDQRFGLIFLFSKQATPEEMKNASKRKSKWTGRYLAFVLVSLVAALLAPAPQYEIVSQIALKRGYVACPRPDWPRHQPDRWAIPGPHGKTELCPGRGADPNR